MIYCGIQFDIVCGSPAKFLARARATTILQLNMWQLARYCSFMYCLEVRLLLHLTQQV